MRKYGRGNKYSRFPKNKNYTEIVDDLGNDRGSNTKPTQNKRINDEINVVARRNMYKSSYAIQVDPYKEVNQASTVYDFITAPNKTFSPDYQGDINLDGGYTSQYLTAKSSVLLNSVDAQVASVALNYRFLNLNNAYESVTNSPTVIDENGNGVSTRNVERGEMLLRKMYDAVNEALSQLDATTFTYLAMNTDYAVITSLRIPQVKADHVFVGTKRRASDTAFNAYMYSDPAAVILVSALAYQIPMLNAVLAFNYVNKTKFYEAEMLHMAYDRETDPLNTFFGQLMKSTFTTKLNSIILSLKGEYVDADFIKTLNMITQIASRDADDIVDPVNEVVGAIVNMPLVAIFSNKTGLTAIDANTTTNAVEYIYNHTTKASLVWSAGDEPAYYWTNTNTDDTALVMFDSFNVATGVKNMRQFVADIAVNYSITGLMHWSRNYNQKKLSEELYNIEQYDINTAQPDFVVKSQIVTTSVDATKLYNHLDYDVTGIAGILNKLKVAFPDLRTVFDKLSPVGLVNWTKGVELIINKKYDQPIEHFIVIDDIMKSVISGATNIRFSPTTGRWVCNTFWDKYEGIPEYDKLSGGQFISFSGKVLDCASSDECNIEYIPKLYNYTSKDPDFVHAIAGSTRLGDLVYTRVQGSTSINSIGEYRRLAILPIHKQESFRIPYIKHILLRSGDVTDLDKVSAIESLQSMNQTRVFGMFKESSTHYVLKTSLIALYTYEILSSASEMIAYAKTAGVFRGTSEGVPAIGFKGLTRN